MATSSMTAPPLSRLSKSALRRYHEARAALPAASADELVALAESLRDEARKTSRTRKGLQSTPARVAAWLGDHTVRYFGVHAYLTTGEVAPLVGALRQATRIEHAVSTARWIADEAHSKSTVPKSPPRVPFGDGSDLVNPPCLDACLHTVATGDPALMPAVLPRSLRPHTGGSHYAVAGDLMLAALHPDAFDETEIVTRAGRHLERKLGAFDRAMLMCLRAILQDDREAFSEAFVETVATQGRTQGLHTPFGATSFLSRPVAIATFGFPVLAALRHGRDWVARERLPAPPSWPVGMLDALLDPAPSLLERFGIEEIDAPEHIVEAERAAWRERQ